MIFYISEIYFLIRISLVLVSPRRNKAHFCIADCFIKICNIVNIQFKCHITCLCHFNAVT